MRARAGDPILSADGSEIVAYWRRGVDLGAEVEMFHIAIPAEMSLEPGSTRTVQSLDRPEVATIRLVQTFPDRSYWRVNEAAPLKWLWSPHVRRALPDAPDEDPAGMALAYELVLADQLPGPWISDIGLRRMRDIWRLRAGFEEKDGETP